MQMKYLLVALVVLLSLAGVAAADGSVEIRSDILEYNAATLAPPGATINAHSWAGFYYNLDDNVYTEELTVVYNSTNTGVNITYHAWVEAVDYAFNDWTIGVAPFTKLQYDIIGFFAEPYVALNHSANKIAPLVIDSNEKYILSVGDSLDIGDGYSIVAQQIDVNGNKAYLQLLYNGQVIDSGIVNSNGSTSDNRTWILEKNVLGEKNIEYLRIHVAQVFQGTQSSLVEIKGIWAADINNAFEVKSGVNYGKFEECGVSSTDLFYEATNVSLSADLSMDLGRGIFIKTNKNFVTGAAVPPQNNKFYFAKVYTAEGTYEIRSTIDYITAGNFVSYDYTNFAAFYYNADDDVDTEKMSIQFNATVKGKIDSGDLKYNTTPEPVRYAFDGWNNNTEYYVMGLFGQAYVPFNFFKMDPGTPPTANLTSKAEKMSKLVLDSNDKYILGVGETLNLGDGYSITAQQIDVNGNKAYLQFLYNGQVIDSGIVNSNSTDADDKTWEITQTLLSEKDVQVLRVQVAQVFQGTQSSLVEIKGVWLMDCKNAKELKTSDSFGSFDLTGLGTTLEFESNKDITISRDTTTILYDNLGLKVSKGTDAFYAYVLRIIGEGESITPPTNPEQPPTQPPEEKPPEEKPPVVTPPEEKPPVTPEKSFWDKYKWVIIIVILIVIVGAGAGVYWAKKNGKF